MTLARMQDLLRDAAAQRRGLVAMNVILLEHAQAIIAGAEAAKQPAVLQVSQNAVAYHRTPAPLLLACLELVRASSAEVCVHLDHATDVDLVHTAVELGVPSVMFDASTLPHQDNLAATAEVVAWCHERGVAVEAELGEVGGKDGVHAHGVRTDPQEAADYAAATGVDSLAVAVGSSHAMTTKNASLDEPLISAIAERVSVPLVLHGSSGVPEDGLLRAIDAGITKVNFGTHLNVVFTGAAREVLVDEKVTDPRKYLGAARDALEAEVARLLRLLSGREAYEQSA